MDDPALQNVTSLTFNFLVVEEKPLLGTVQSTVLTVQGLIILLFGLLIHARIYVMLNNQKSERTDVAIDRLFQAHNLINIFCQPTFLGYLIVSFNLFPMVDYVGNAGCIFFSHILQIFTTIYCLLFPLTIAVVRFLFVVCHGWTRRFGISNVVNGVLLLSVAIPSVMTFSLQYPVSDFVHAPLNFCKGRFEVLFNPTHPDPLSPGKVFLLSQHFYDWQIKT